jgi:hypothetical protein
MLQVCTRTMVNLLAGRSKRKPGMQTGPGQKKPYIFDWIERGKRLFSDRYFLLGLILGLVALAVAGLFQLLLSGRPLNNPMSLILFLTHLLRSLSEGFSYLDWISPLKHILFLGVIAISANLLAGSRWGVGRDVARSKMRGLQAEGVARIAVLISAAIPGVTATDSLIVGVYYITAIFLSMGLSAMITRRIAPLFPKQF